MESRVLDWLTGMGYEIEGIDFWKNEESSEKTVVFKSNFSQLRAVVCILSRSCVASNHGCWIPSDLASRVGDSDFKYICRLTWAQRVGLSMGFMS